ncbi:hypothetical protein N5C55_12520 [Pseudomonas otitidis]|uniref:Uncharacterized protein n=1 Tax=Metapseudomonas otitidis TaxID=319939 RepID=A0ABU3XM32_9GAMM|nr:MULTISPECIES: hypothetical protein [Pseudomonas]MDH0334465.1 hypothetical protein [Pseudomonas otitidis]MDH1107347.1 hypothetical protein [Pseudomonas otitidis]MDH1158993.1 hypothetical protein [Pseudomonas otitidis]MDH1163309.1 hypothetical protein [Pseudomonas otitidis]MDU9398388.1 hypothetical protein [Pseudomonas sp. zfem003]
MSAKTFYWLAAAAAVTLAPQVFLPALLGVGACVGVALIGLAWWALLFPPRQHR